MFFFAMFEGGRYDNHIEYYDTDALIYDQSEDDQWVDVVATIYHAVESQCDDTPLITSCGHNIDTAKVRTGEERTIALSRDLLEKFKYGTEVMVSIDGHDEYCCTYVVRDCMNARYTNCIDLLVDPSIKHGKYNARIKSL